MYVKTSGMGGLRGLRGMGDVDPKMQQLSGINNSVNMAWLAANLQPQMSGGGWQGVVNYIGGDPSKSFLLANMLQSAMWGNNTSGYPATVANWARLLGQNPGYIDVLQHGAVQVGSSTLMPTGDLVPTGGGSIFPPPGPPQINPQIYPLMPPPQVPLTPANQPIYALPQPINPQPTDRIPAPTPPVLAPAYTPNYTGVPTAPVMTPAASSSSSSSTAASSSDFVGSITSWISANPMLAAGAAVGALFIFGGMGGRR